MRSSHSLDRVDTAFDDDRLVPTRASPAGTLARIWSEGSDREPSRSSAARSAGERSDSSCASSCRRSRVRLYRIDAGALRRRRDGRSPRLRPQGSLDSRHFLRSSAGPCPSARCGVSPEWVARAWGRAGTWS